MPRRRGREEPLLVLSLVGRLGRALLRDEALRGRAHRRVQAGRRRDPGRAAGLRQGRRRRGRRPRRPAALGRVPRRPARRRAGRGGRWRRAARRRAPGDAPGRGRGRRDRGDERPQRGHVHAEQTGVLGRGAAAGLVLVERRGGRAQRGPARRRAQQRRDVAVRVDVRPLLVVGLDRGVVHRLEVGARQREPEDRGAAAVAAAARRRVRPVDDDARAMEPEERADRALERLARVHGRRHEHAAGVAAVADLELPSLIGVARGDDAHGLVARALARRLRAARHVLKVRGEPGRRRARRRGRLGRGLRVVLGVRLGLRLARAAARRRAAAAACAALLARHMAVIRACRRPTARGIILSS